QVVGRESTSEGYTRYFRGAIDDVRIYGRALSIAEIKAPCPHAPEPPGRDPRNIRTGLKIPDEGYCDQPYVVITKDGNWLCTLTTGIGEEGQGGQHVVSTISSDQGHTWSKLVDIEPATGPAASWVVPLLVPSGRVYGFYTYNGDHVDTLQGNRIRNDTLGWYVYKYSDDGGQTWSEDRYRLPYRLTACDRSNDWRGKVQLFWGIDKPKVFGKSVVFASTKLGRYMLDQGEGWLLCSDNILTELEPTKIRWELLPEGEHGIRADEFGSIQEEHNMVPLGGTGLYCVYRTTTGYPCHTYSTNGGRTWEKPRHMTYTPGGRRVKNPRACPKLWRTANGRYIFWFHNHNGKTFSGRNPVWVSGGVERGGKMYWSEPEILLYHNDLKAKGMSYPDLIEQDGRYWVTETQKSVARVHELDPSLLEGLWNQGEARSIARDGLVAEAASSQGVPRILKLPGLLGLAETCGLSLDFWVQFDTLDAGQVLLDSRTPEGEGILIETADGDSVRFVLNDGKTRAAWTCDAGSLTPGKLHHVVATADAGPNVITFVIDGKLCDGGPTRQYGWGRFPATMGNVTGTGIFRIGPSLRGNIVRVRVYNRYLRTSEAVAHFHAGS
ncbi:MAG: exo-alpha-sialidase, partial [Pirellulales bacterium]|nr:exo-alpha-sialidase [Pirellulales bacterium]